MSIRNVLIAGILMTAALAVNAETAQQDKMKGCNEQAKTQALHGDARKSFMKTCLSNAPAAAPAAAAAAPAAAEPKKLTAQQEKMKTCNADAKTKALKGAERKAFMKTCLSGK